MPDPAALSEARRKLLEQYIQAGAGASEADRIPRRQSDAPAPLSAAQQQVWVHAQLAPDLPIYNEPMTVHRRGPLDQGVLERSIVEILRRHEMWRSTFDVVDGQPVQVVQPPPASLALPFIDLRGVPEGEREAQASLAASREARLPFDLRKGPIWRATLMRLGEEDYRLYLTIHQIILDGITANHVFLPELIALYDAFSQGKPSPLPELPVQYSDFACWERERLGPEALEKQLGYWKERLGDGLSALRWPSDRVRPAVQTYRGEMQPLMIPGELVRKLKAFSQGEGATLFICMVAGLAALLHRYTGQDDIAIGTLSANRKRAEIEKLLGYFLNPLVLRIDVSGNPSFRELLGRVREVVFGALAHDGVPFQRLVKELQSERDLSRNPLFQIMISLEPSLPALAPGWDLAEADVSSGASKLDLYIDLDERPDGIIGPITYNPDLFDAATITRMVAHWQTLLEGAVADPDSRVATLPVLTGAERNELLVKSNETRRSYPAAPVHRLFEEQVRRRPGAVAVVFEKTRLTYGELNRRANQVAHHLQSLGVGPEVMAGISMERGPDMIVALLGILKAGGAYVPLDPAYPDERLAFMLKDAAPRVLLTEKHLKYRLPACDTRVVCLDSDWKLIGRERQDDPVSEAKPENLAYMIYTSGSTGQPKGVQIEHRSLVNFLNSMLKEPGMESGDTLLAVTTLSFDISGLEIYLPLIAGAKVVLARRETAQDGRALLRLLEESRATVMQATPATWRMLVETGWRGATRLKVLCGGEALPENLAADLRERSDSVWNMYGPTETTIWSSIYRLRPGDKKAGVLGPPIANTEFYVLDRNGQPVPAGIEGELYIGGEGVARGYYERPELTAAKFVPNPFSGKQGARLYRTGDLMRRLPGGTLEFLGRIDLQVKVRGYRIELGEIEAELGQYPGVKAAVAVTRPDAQGDQSLVAYAIPAEGTALTSAVLRNHLRTKLPEYMVPGRFVFLAEFPALPNGKLNRAALPAPDALETVRQETHVPPRNAIELKLASVWESVLKTEPIGVTDDFFERGGHSLLAANLLVRIEKAFGATLSIAALFQAPTIEKMAELLRAPGITGPPVEIVPIQPLGSRPPVFCVSIGAGPMFRALAQRLRTDQPFLGLDLRPSVIADLPTPYRLEDIARHLVKAIREYEPEGPYFLAGHCINALIAYEMARQLKAEGARVAQLVMFHAQNPAPRADYSSGSQIEELARRFSFRQLRRHSVTLRQMELRETSLYVGARLRDFFLDLQSLVWRVSIPLRLRLGHGRLGSVREILWAAARTYVPGPYSGGVALFRSTERRAEAFEDFHAGWREVVSGPVDVYEIPGKYWAIYSEPAVSITAERMSKCLLTAHREGDCAWQAKVSS